jgi:beta-galactosidase
MLFSSNGRVAINYAFIAKTNIAPRQIGLVFDLPSSYDSISWRRKAQWSVYPEDHIGRAVGTAKAFPRGVNVEGLATPRTCPDWPWSEDANELGSNDFRSTKMNIFEAALQAKDGPAIRVISDGSQDFRAWVDGERVRFLVADYSNEGSADFFIEHVIATHPLKPGSEVNGRIVLNPTDER